MPPRKLNAPVLRNPTFRWLAFWLFISHLGNWMEGAAINWTVLQRTNSPALLSLAVVLLYVPRSLFSPLGGKLSDRYSPRTMMLIAQACMALQSIALFVTVQIEGTTGTTLLFLLQALSSIMIGFNVPAQETMVHLLVPEKWLHNARAIMSSSAFMAGIFGPTIAGVFIGMGMTMWIFLLNASSYIMLIVYLFRLLIGRTTPSQEIAAEHKGSVLQAFQYIKATPRISQALLLGGMVDFCVSNTSVTQVLIGKQLGGPREYAMLTAAASIGSLVGAFILAGSNRQPTMRRILVSAALYCLFSTACGPSALLRSLTLTMGSMGLATIASEYLGIAIGTQRQTGVPQRLRGSVNGIAQAIRVASIGLSSLFAGVVLVPLLTISYAIIAAGAMGLLSVAVIWRSAKRKQLLEPPRLAPRWVSLAMMSIIRLTKNPTRI